MQQPARSGDGTSLHLRQVDSHRGLPAVGKIAKLAGHKPTNVGLRLLGGTSDMGGTDHVRDFLQAVGEPVSGTLRLVGEDVQRGTGNVPTEQVLSQRLMINDEAAA